jgi:hypothetical protein
MRQKQPVATVCQRMVASGHFVTGFNATVNGDAGNKLVVSLILNG